MTEWPKHKKDQYGHVNVKALLILGNFQFWRKLWSSSYLFRQSSIFKKINYIIIKYQLFRFFLGFWRHAINSQKYFQQKIKSYSLVKNWWVRFKNSLKWIHTEMLILKTSWGILNWTHLSPILSSSGYHYQAELLCVCVGVCVCVCVCVSLIRISEWRHKKNTCQTPPEGKRERERERER